MSYVLYEDTYQTAPFADILVCSTTQYNTLENTFMDFFIKNQPQTDIFGHIGKSLFCEISFRCFISQILEYSDLTQVIAASLLTNFTFVLQKISEWQFLIIFCYTELLFPRNPESNGTLLSSRPFSFILGKFFLEIEKFFQENNRSSTKSK